MLSTMLGAEHTLPGERCSVLAPALWERAHGQNAAWPCRAGCTGAQEKGGRVVAAGGGELTQCWGAAVSVIHGCVTSHPEMWRLKQQFLGGHTWPGSPRPPTSTSRLPSAAIRVSPGRVSSESWPRDGSASSSRGWRSSAPRRLLEAGPPSLLAVGQRLPEDLVRGPRHRVCVRCHSQRGTNSATCRSLCLP